MHGPFVGLGFAWFILWAQFACNCWSAYCILYLLVSLVSIRLWVSFRLAYISRESILYLSLGYFYFLTYPCLVPGLCWFSALRGITVSFFSCFYSLVRGFKSWNQEFKRVKRREVGGFSSQICPSTALPSPFNFRRFCSVGSLVATLWRC